MIQHKLIPKAEIFPLDAHCNWQQNNPPKSTCTILMSRYTVSPQDYHKKITQTSKESHIYSVSSLFLQMMVLDNI